jgi:opacity protein-like surface antigen
MRSIHALVAAFAFVLSTAASAQEAAPAARSPEAAAPAASAPEAAAPTASAARPIRADRRIMVGAELGWNSLAGFGVNAAYHVLPWFSVDAGVGMSSFGLKTGLRARANLLTSEWTPFVAAGFLYGVGSGDRVLTTPINASESVSFRLGGSPFVQAVAGVDYTSDSGFTLLVTAGYAFLMGSNVNFVGNPPSAAGVQVLNTAFGSGLSAGVTLGYSF